MTKDEIIRMAHYYCVGEFDKIGLIKFFHAAQALERRECLKICEEQASTNYWEGADVCAETIKERSNNEWLA